MTINCQVFDHAGDRVTGQQLSSRALTVLLATAYVVVASSIGITLLLTVDGMPLSPVLDGEAQSRPVPSSGQAVGTEPTDSSRARAATGTTASATSTANMVLQNVTGPLGIVAPAPADWQPKECVNAQGVQVDDPIGKRFLRLGAHPSYGGALLAVRTSEERKFAQSHTGYELLRHDSVEHRGREAVEWEFEWDDAGQRRHALALFWRVGATDYWIYASAEVTRWAETQPIYQEMARQVTP
jgi:hypothetical protein